MFEELIAEARTRGDPWIVGRLFFLAELEVASGEWRGQHDCVTSRWSSHVKRVGTIFFRFPAASWCRSLHYRGEVERVRTETPDLLQVAERTGIADYAYELGRSLASFELSVGDAESAWSHVEPLFAQGREMDEYRAQVAGSVGNRGAYRHRRPSDCRASARSARGTRRRVRAQPRAGLLIARAGLSRHRGATRNVQSLRSRPPPSSQNRRKRRIPSSWRGRFSSSGPCNARRSTSESPGTPSNTPPRSSSARRAPLVGEGGLGVAADRRAHRIGHGAVGDRATDRRARGRRPPEP